MEPLDARSLHLLSFCSSVQVVFTAAQVQQVRGHQTNTRTLLLTLSFIIKVPCISFGFLESGKRPKPREEMTRLTTCSPFPQGLLSDLINWISGSLLRFRDYDFTALFSRLLKYLVLKPLSGLWTQTRPCSGAQNCCLSSCTTSDLP